MFSRFINRSLALTAAMSVYADVAYAEELRIKAIDVQAMKAEPWRISHLIKVQVGALSRICIESLNALQSI